MVVAVEEHGRDELDEADGVAAAVPQPVDVVECRIAPSRSVQARQVAGRGDDLLVAAPLDLVALAGRGEVLEHEREGGRVLGHRAVEAVRDGDGEAGREVGVEADLVAVAAGGARGAALLARRRELDDERRRRARVRVRQLEPVPLVVGHLPRTHRLPGEAGDDRAVPGSLQHGGEPFRGHRGGILDDRLHGLGG